MLVTQTYDQPSEPEENNFEISAYNSRKDDQPSDPAENNFKSVLITQKDEQPS